MENHRTEKSIKKEEYWRNHLQAWKASGESQAQYCRDQQLKWERFHYWKKKFRQEKPRVLRLVAIDTAGKSVPAADPECGIRISWKGLKVEVHEGFDSRGLKTILETIGSWVCGE